jgi:hypothetical protein
MRKAPVPPASAPVPFPPRKNPQPSACKDTSPKQQPYFFAVDGELYAPQPEQNMARARAA